MTSITQRMREELVRRNYAESTIRAYLRTVEEFRQQFHKRLDHMTPDDIRRYQVYLLENRKLAVGTVVGHVETLREYWRWMRPKTYLFNVYLEPRWTLENFGHGPPAVYLALRRRPRRLGVRRNGVGGF